MSSSTHFVDPAHFHRQSDEFMTWLASRPSVRVSSKIQVADLRSADAGRGVGTFFLTAKAISGLLLLKFLVDVCLIG